MHGAFIALIVVSNPPFPVFPAAEPGLVVGDEQAKCFSALPTKTQNNRTVGH